MIRHAPAPAAPSTAAKATTPAVSVCIVNWNCRGLLRRCLDSLLTQEQGVSFEVLVVDNASADGAADMVAREFPGVRLIRNSANVGFSRANNQAARVARGQYLFFLNNDTEVPPHCLIAFAEYAARHPQVGMIGPRLLGSDGEPQISYRARPTLGALLHRISLLRWTGTFRGAYTRYRRSTYHADGTRPVEALMGAAVFLPRHVFEQSGRWDERYSFGGEDLDLSAQVNRRHQVVYFSGVELLHHGRAASRANVRFSSPNVLIGYVHYFRKAGVPGPLLVVYKALVTLDAPVQILGKLTQTATRLVRGRPAKAHKSLLAARGVWSFARHDLGRFWRA